MGETLRVPIDSGSWYKIVSRMVKVKADGCGSLMTEFSGRSSYRTRQGVKLSARVWGDPSVGSLFPSYLSVSSLIRDHFVSPIQP